MRKFFLILIAGLCMSACSEFDSIEFLNLKRDNPLDGKNNSDLKGGIDVKFDTYSIYKDNNNDKIINKGETVELRVSLKNTGSSAAKAVKATFSTTSNYISGFTPTAQVNYGDIAASGTKWADYAGSSGTSDYYLNYYTIKFTVSNTTPSNTNIPISISITDENNNTWTSSFEVKVEGTNAQISYDTFSVYKDNNNDDIVNKGETVELRVSLKNTGSSAAKAVKATFSTTSNYVSGFTPTAQVNYGDIAAYGTKWADYAGSSGTSDYYLNYYTMKFTVSNSTPTNSNIPMSISITDESNNTWTSSFNVTVQ